MSKNSVNIGIDDMSLYIPKLYLPISTLAAERKIEYDKLNKGLGLTNMAIPDVHEDAATMAANAVAELIDRNNLNPTAIGRIYLGTESGLDGAKPTATYVTNMLSQKYAPIYGHHCFLNCDVVDLTFACVGGVDALHNTLDWVRGDEERIGIVVCSDFAKYELASTGEYTQGAGAVAMLVKHQPRLLRIDEPIGVAMNSEHDFYKPLRTFSKAQIIAEVLQLAGIDHMNSHQILEKLTDSLEVTGLIDDNEETINLHKETPIFDGPFSNLTYQNRIREAYAHFRQKAVDQAIMHEEDTILDRWERLIFHLPYAFHGKRIFMEIFVQELQRIGKWSNLASKYDLQIPSEAQFNDQKSYDKAYAHFLKAVSQTEEYRNLVKEKVAKAQYYSGEIGNMYAASIFLALMGTLEADSLSNSSTGGKKVGFFGYGSGSKSKVFEATVQPEWASVVSKFNIAEKLKQRTALDYATYEKLHRKQLKDSILSPTDEFALTAIGQEGVTLGARYYTYANSQVMA
jgi:hydroxymethylglutaryl-CoA synthase